MTSKKIIPAAAETDDERRLEELEAKIARGLAAYAERNQLIYDMTMRGYRQADLVRRLNRIRALLGVSTLTPDSIAATIRRVRAGTPHKH
jgi:uncharacterized coiled-coil protein SlyX